MKYFLLSINLLLLFTQCTEVPDNNLNADFTQIEWSPELSEKISKDFTSYMKKLHVPGAAMAIIHKGKVIKKEYFGYADIDLKIPVTESTEFWLASISKHITTSLILKLEENGFLSRQDYVRDIIPELTDKWNGIKLEHLMSHTSGIYGYDNFEKLDSWWEHLYADKYEGKEIPLKEFIDMLQYVPIGPDPGEVFDYSDTGMDVLAAVATYQTGKSFEQLLSEYFFIPSDMTTKLFDRSSPNTKLVKGYSYSKQQLTSDKNREDYLNIGNKAFAGAGNLIVSLQDMINWNLALDNNSILEEETKKLLWTPYKLSSGETIKYGLGLNLLEFPGGYAIGHGGVAGTEYWKFPEANVSIIILTNLARGSGGLLAKVTEDLGLLDSIKPDPLFSMFAKKPGELNKECLPTGTFSFKGFDGTVYIENEEPFFLVPGMIYNLIPLENCEYMAFSKGTNVLDGSIPNFYLKIHNEKLIMVLEDDHPWGSELEGNKILD